MKSKYITYKEHKLHYTVFGKGPTVLLLHGFMEPSIVWDELASSWASFCTVICVDLPGHGLSEAWGDVHGMRGMAAAVEHLLEEEQAGATITIGHSMGGYVAMAMLDMYPTRIAAMGLFHSHAMKDGEEGIENRKRVIKLLEEKDGQVGFITRFMPTLFAEKNVERMRDKISILTEEAKKMSAEAIIATQRGMIDRESYVVNLSESRIPFLFVIGRNDTKLAHSNVITQAMLCNNADILWLPCGHMGFWEESERCKEFIGDFIKRVFGLR